jgi:hypothetical protein
LDEPIEVDPIKLQTFTKIVLQIQKSFLIIPVPYLDFLSKICGQEVVFVLQEHQVCDTVQPACKSFVRFACTRVYEVDASMVTNGY